MGTHLFGSPCTLFWILSISGIRAMSTALHTPQLGGHAVTGDPKFRA